MDRIIVLIISSCDGEPTVPQVHYYHGNSTICARFCYSSENALGAPVRSPSSSSCCPADLHVLNGFVTVRPSCSTPNSSQAWTSASKFDRWLRWFRLQTSRGISRQSVLIRRPAFPPTFSAAALAVSAAIDCEHVDARGRELRNASGPEEKKTLERQIKDQDDLINRYQADLTKRGG